MKGDQIKLLVFLAQGIGVLFYAIFLAAFYLPMPSNDTLIGDPTFRTPLSIFGGIFIILILTSLIAAYIRNQEK
jgi:hypothetical protein